MKKHWNEIQPVDLYTTSLQGVLHETDRKILTLLYQPLIGAKCFSLYMTLWAEVEENRLRSSGSSHYHLMNFMDINIQEIYEERMKLEGLGLLKSYVKKHGDSREFVYVLQPPLTPEQFFNDGMLNIFLYRKIGRAHFLRLKEFFMDDQVITNEHQEITKDFQDVFTTGSLMDQEAMESSTTPEGKRLMKTAENSGLPLNSEEFNFSLLESSLRGVMIPKQVLTKPVRETILKLSHLYGIQALEMKNLLLTAVDEQDEIDLELLRKSARDWYQLEMNEELPELINRVQPAALRSVSDAPQTKEEELIFYLETTSPRQLLIDISGSQPSQSDMKIIEGILFQYKLSAGVTNVLIQYVMLKTDMKLTKSYVEKIASHWARKQVKTVSDAMELAKSEHRQYLEWAENKDKPKRRKSIRKEKLPEWFQKEEDPAPSSSTEDEDFEKERQLLEAELKGTRKKEGEVSRDGKDQ
ncbi:replication initiation and membrane attachment protein [Bacillus ectoiniformans]|uniref:replication initiation and membrane attachment family protein n=1 Tax=Bacillus ectoiniformans TaxID=1494429 RepID=UPI00195809ED|nr:replication initiation and membrane attachment family protein [Bacillus ectoiniformans]MBM7648858.1 replication initiation and membrane attachment protein [Bacillus ectoiniformans]